MNIKSFLINIIKYNKVDVKLSDTQLKKLEIKQEQL